MIRLENLSKQYPGQSTPAVHELDLDINDPAFADAMANRLHELVEEAARS